VSSEYFREGVRALRNFLGVLRLVTIDFLDSHIPGYFELWIEYMLECVDRRLGQKRHSLPHWTRV